MENRERLEGVLQVTFAALNMTDRQLRAVADRAFLRTWEGATTEERSRAFESYVIYQDEATRRGIALEPADRIGPDENCPQIPPD